MATFGNLIGAFMQQALPPSGGNRVGNALEQLRQSNVGGAGGMAGNNMLTGILGSVGQGLQGAAGNPLQAGGLGALAGSLLGGGRGAVGGGALALLASVAMQALQSRATTETAAAPRSQAPAGGAMPLGLRPPENRDEEAALESKAKWILKGMINAAKADGQISPDEMQRIVDKLTSVDQDPALQQWVMEQMAAPLDIQGFAAEIPSPEIAAEVYAASLLAIEVDTDAERRYLQQFAQATGLHPLVTAQIHQTLGVAA